MQSWGTTSRYKQRATDAMPTKSGVLGLIASAQGRRRTDPLEDLADLFFAVRVDQPGTLLRDYQTSQDWRAGKATNLVTRYYLADAVFVAAIQSPNREFLESIEQALNNPRYMLYLGRRSCPVSPDLVIGIQDTDAVTALQNEPWHASYSHRLVRTRRVILPIYRDARPGESGLAAQDVPVSFSQEHRRYSWREIVGDEGGAPFENPDGRADDPYFEAVVAG